MALNYKIIENKGVYDILETTTEQIIKSFSDNQEARKLLRHLNLGGGFESWTPTFFLQTAGLKESFD